MRHRVTTKTFGRSTKHRQAMIKNMVRSLVEKGSITTSTEKAKEIKRWADKLIGQAKTDSVASRRQLHAFFGKRDVVNTLVERVAPAMGKRVSGFTSLKKIGRRRGDNAELATLSLIVQPDRVGTLRSENPGKTQSKTTKKVAKATKTASKPKQTSAKKTAESKPAAKKATPKKAKSTKKSTAKTAKK